MLKRNGDKAALICRDRQTLSFATMLSQSHQEQPLSKETSDWKSRISYVVCFELLRQKISTSHQHQSAEHSQNRLLEKSSVLFISISYTLLDTIICFLRQCTCPLICLEIKFDTIFTWAKHCYALSKNDYYSYRLFLLGSQYWHVVKKCPISTCFGLSWLISPHIILFILPAEHYLLDQPNSP